MALLFFGLLVRGGRNLVDIVDQDFSDILVVILEEEEPERLQQVEDFKGTLQERKPDQTMEPHGEKIEVPGLDQI